MSQDQKIKPWVQELAGIIGQARDQHELEVLLEGLLTPSELEGLHLRWHLLRQLRKGCTQREISRNLGVSLGTIYLQLALDVKPDHAFALAALANAQEAAKRYDDAIATYDRIPKGTPLL